MEEARLLLHVTDASDPQRAGQDAAVEALLEELGVAATPRLHVWNKVDLLAPEEQRRLEAEDRSVTVSAQTGEGLENLRQRIAETLSADPMVEADFEFSSSDGKQLALLHQSGTVVSTRYEADRVLVRAKVPESLREKLKLSPRRTLRER